MDADQVAMAATMLTLLGVPVGLVFLVWHLSKPPKNQPDEREEYPDPHLFV